MINRIGESDPTTETTIVVGLVHANGCAGVGGAANNWSLRFKFYAWRSKDGVLHRDRLDLKREMTHESLDSYMDRIAAYSILRVRVILTGDTSAEFIELLAEAVDTDQELTQLSIELQKPVIYEHEQFGTLVFNRAINWWETTVDWAGKTIRLSLAATETEALEQTLQTAISLWKEQLIWNQRITAYAVQGLLELKNEVWYEEDEPDLTPDEFKARMSLNSITVYADGHFEFWHDDGDLFFGHWIWVMGDLQNGPTHVSIAG